MRTPNGVPSVDPDALLCALILAPQTFSRNRFHKLFEDPSYRRVRKRAARVRGVIRQLSGTGRYSAEWLGEQVLADEQVLIRYRIPELDFSRSVALTALEAATLRYATARGEQGQPTTDDQARVQEALARLAPVLPDFEPNNPTHSESSTD